MDNFKYLYIYFALLGYLIIIFLNVTLFVLIILEKSLHEPMYIFIGTLSFNGLYGGMAFFPKLIVDLLSEKQTISHVACLIQVFFIHTFVAFEFSILTVMAYDRYVAICTPLRYADIMNNSTICKLLAAAWGLPICFTAMNVLLTMRLPICGSIIEKPYCQLWSVLKLSCVDASINYSFSSFITLILALNFICIEPLIMPSLINPVIYGLKTKEINLKLKKRFAKTTKKEPITNLNCKWYHSLNVQITCNADSNRVYPLQPGLLTPFLHPTGRPQRLYNAGLNRACNITECCFGQLKMRFHYLDCTIGLIPKIPVKVCHVFIVCYLMHNLEKHRILLLPCGPDEPKTDATEK
nr:PREDICTED: olfactory receptor 4S2-like [Latimeria chalumnae]|eukprot:XP_014353753.1 PREDICTED: olfactory receptor 4S2-like [Latimeria chalumnae]